MDKSIGEFSMAYKKMSSVMWLRVYNHNFDLWFQLHMVCLDILNAVLTFCFTHVSSDMQIS